MKQLLEKPQNNFFSEYKVIVAAGAEAGNGRFLVMNGCMKSNCPWEFGTVVLDGFTGALNVMRFAPDENVFDHASSGTLKNEIDSYWLSEVDTQQKYSLSIENGRLRATRKRGK